ncbi:MAG: Ig-like domain-containing protein [Nakamurella sp.]
MNASASGKRGKGKRFSARWCSAGTVVAVALLVLSACSSGHSGGAAASSAPHTTGSSTGAPGATSQPTGAEVTAPGLTTSASPSEAGNSESATQTAVPVAPAAEIVTSSGSQQAINPVTPITVKVTGGTLASVRLMDSKEHLVVRGAMAADHLSWTSTQVLGYGKGYALEADAINPDGVASRSDTDFSTLKPGNMTMPYMDRIGGDALGDGQTYGVGIVPVVHFDEPITNKKAAEQALHVTTNPSVAGAWYWADNQNVHWRPKGFWVPGTTVTIAADVYGVDVGNNLYGQSDVTASFTIGRAQITQAYDNAPHGVDKVNVYDGAGAVLRTMNTSMGKHGGVTVNGKYINFYTLGGTYTVLEHDNPEMMSSASYGLPADAPGGYKPEPIYYSTRISNGGIFLHELDSTVWAQNHGVDASHGCLNLSKANAVWFFNHSMIGDPVIIHGAAGAPGIQVWDGGDWSVPWTTWLAGSALH